jgi:hypothetical protein
MAESSEKQISDKKQLAASGAEVIFLVFLVAFGMGLSVAVEKRFTWFFSEPNEQRYVSAPGIKEKQERVARLENAIKEAEKEVDAVALERLKHTAALKSLEKSHPGIGKPRQATAPALPAEAEKNYEIAKMQQLAADEYAALLHERITTLKKEATETAAVLEPEKQAATQRLMWWTRLYRAAKFGVSFLLPLIVVVVAFYAGSRFLNRVAGKQVWTTHGSLPIVLVSCALLILLAYQAFEIAGAVFIGLILFLILLRKIKWSPRVSEKETAE